MTVIYCNEVKEMATINLADFKDLRTPSTTRSNTYKITPLKRLPSQCSSFAKASSITHRVRNQLPTEFYCMALDFPIDPQKNRGNDHNIATIISDFDEEFPPILGAFAYRSQDPRLDGQYVPESIGNYIANLLLDHAEVTPFGTSVEATTNGVEIAQRFNIALLGKEVTWQHPDVYKMGFDELIYEKGLNKVIAEFDTKIESVKSNKEFQNYFLDFLGLAKD